ncbi:MAG: hypothetical protein D6788_02880 [Planctomycetota bacterium]|nr:MAG: hypothetical protein D6788_02880 [Planctomycetota bacterium]
MSWDPSCLHFNGISTVEPYTTVLAKEVDMAGGHLFWAVGVGFDPMTGDPLPGTNGNTSFGTLSFTKLPGCGDCDICAGPGINPGDTLLSDDTGQAVGVDLSNPCATALANDEVVLVVPDDMKVNTDCGSPTAIVDVGTAHAAASCGSVNLVCDNPVGPVELTPGVHQFCCTATSVDCGTEVSDCWTVTVNDQQTLDLVVQLSPPIVADDLNRCITFELISDCVTGSPNNLTFSADLNFGGDDDFTGHFTDALKTPVSGQWVCITARDQQHTLRAAAPIDCGPDGAWHAVFKGDPFFGGNWLTGGNLDGWKKDNPNASHDVIDILDFGQLVWMWGTMVDPNTACNMGMPMDGPHGDIDGDGMVNMGDFNFVANNFLSMSKNACCPSGVAGQPVARTEVSVRELREMGLGELAVADLNGDGLVNMDDIQAFMNGERPATKKPGLRNPKGSLRSSR